MGNEFKNTTIGEIPLGPITKVKVQIVVNPNGIRFLSFWKFRRIGYNWIPLGKKQDKTSGSVINLDKYNNRERIIPILEKVIEELKRMEPRDE